MSTQLQHPPLSINLNLYGAPSSPSRDEAAHHNHFLTLTEELPLPHFELVE